MCSHKSFEIDILLIKPDNSSIINRLFSFNSEVPPIFCCEENWKTFRYQYKSPSGTEPGNKYVRKNLFLAIRFTDNLDEQPSTHIYLEYLTVQYITPIKVGRTPIGYIYGSAIFSSAAITSIFKHFSTTAVFDPYQEHLCNNMLPCWHWFLRKEWTHSEVNFARALSNSGVLFWS